MEKKRLRISSPAFRNEGEIPSKYTCEGEDISPALRIEDIPEGTVSLAMIVEDPDAPRGTFDHWIVWNIEPLEEIPEGYRPGISGDNSAGRTGYMGPCPPTGLHRYYFHIFALDTELHLPAGSNKETLQQAMDGHTLAQGSLLGRYKKRGI